MVSPNTLSERDVLNVILCISSNAVGSDNFPIKFLNMTTDFT